MGIWIYSSLLAVGMVLTAPWWGWRMLTSGRYRAGLGERLGRVSAGVRAAVAGKRVVWVHAVSVGEVLACVRLVRELQGRLGEDWVVVVSTTTATGQTVARERFGAGRVFYFPLDFGFAVRAWLRVLRPELVVLVESELWPRMLWECERLGVPVAVVNARVSDRAFRRALRVKRLWGWMRRRVRVFLAQGEESAGRLRELGAERVRVVGNLKYDLGLVRENAIAERVRAIAAGRPVLVAASTLGGEGRRHASEEEMILRAWKGELRSRWNALLVMAPRHPQRFDEAAAFCAEFPMVRASVLRGSSLLLRAGTDIVVLDTLGDLAAVYGLADVAFIGGSLVSKGGHNPLEAARFGVPVVMGESYENFREIVEGLRAVGGIRITSREGLEEALTWALREGKVMGERGRVFFERQSGATGRTVEELMGLIAERVEIACA